MGSVVCLGLLLLGPAPLSACAMLADAVADCAPVPPASAHGGDECDRMAMPQPSGDEMEAGLASCCQAKAPLPQAAKSTTTVVAPDFTAQDLPGEFVATVRPALDSPASSLPVSPPERQSLLCVFLI